MSDSVFQFFGQFSEKLYGNINFAAFLLIISVALAFHEEHRAHFRMRMAVSGLIALALTEIYSLLPPGPVLYMLKYLLTFVLVCQVLCIDYDLTRWGALYYVTCGYSVQHICQNLFIVTDTLFGLCGVTIREVPGLFAGLEIAFNLSGALAFALVFGGQIQSFSRKRVHQSLAFPMCILLTATTILYILGFNVQDSGARLLLCAYGILLCVSVLYAIAQINRIGEAMWERNAMALLLRNQQKQYEASRTNVEYLNILEHDLKKQLHLLRGKVPLERLEKMEQVLDEYESTADTGNEILDVILTEISMRCTLEGISFTYMVDGRQLDFMNPMDLCSLFYNLLENALESVKQIENPKERVISLKMFTVDGFLRITSFNSVRAGKELRRDEQGNVTTDKKEVQGHGFGLRSMKRVVMAYGGEMTCDLEDGVFSIQVLLPRNAEASAV